MGVAARWLKGLFGIKTKKKCSRKEKGHSKSGFEEEEEEEEARRRAIAVAAATAAAAEAAVAAAHAAAAVVKLTAPGKVDANSNSNTNAITSSPSVAMRKEWAAAVMIQSQFRGYLSRRALRALKGLVKIQALVRGYLVRKQTAQFLQRLQTLVRVQAKACDCRAFSSELGIKNSSYLRHLGPVTPEKYDYRARSMKYGEPLCVKKTGSFLTESEYYDAERARILRDDERNIKILEVDSGIPKTMLKSRRFNYPSYYNSTRRDRKCKSFSMSKDTMMSPSSVEVQSLGHFEYAHYADDYDEDTLSPTFYSSRGKSSRKGMYTPTRSDGTSSCYQSGYLVHPNYMAYTESSKAKVRSLSVPKLRYQPLERSYSSTKRYNVYGDSGPMMQTGLETFDNRDYPGSGLLDRLGMPISSHWRRCQ